MRMKTRKLIRRKNHSEKINLHKKSKFTLDDIGEKLNTLITQNNSLMKKLEKQKEEILDLKKDFDRLETQQQQMKEEIAHLKGTSQQKNLKNNAVISGIDAKNMNDTQIKGVVITYGQKLNVQLSSENFEAYKIGKNSERLKVCFKEFSIKSQIMNTKKNVQIKAEDIGLTGNNYIFINQDHTFKSCTKK
ncbi:hypothetical protein HHI36_001477 [Cryptolaemus montrouzieri]|uniref:Uncharacterized protein n=1 Tax=Cryptolaemus montrouzieri TaxID=559131 RepID=A0ABD2P8F7_9CUCU